MSEAKYALGVTIGLFAAGCAEPLQSVAPTQDAGSLFPSADAPWSDGTMGGMADDGVSTCAELSAQAFSAYKELTDGPQCVEDAQPAGAGAARGTRIPRKSPTAGCWPSCTPRILVGSTTYQQRIADAMTTESIVVPCQAFAAHDCEVPVHSCPNLSVYDPATRTECLGGVCVAPEGGANISE